MTEIAITRAGAERIDDVEPLWHAMGLMVAVFEELRRLGVEEIALAVMEGNGDAVRFYERRGLVPYLRLTIGRVPPAP